MSEDVLVQPTLSAGLARSCVGSQSVEGASRPSSSLQLTFGSATGEEYFPLTVEGVADEPELDLGAALVVERHDDQVRARETIDLLGLNIDGPVGWIAGLGVDGAILRTDPLASGVEATCDMPALIFCAELGSGVVDTCDLATRRSRERASNDAGYRTSPTTGRDWT